MKFKLGILRLFLKTIKHRHTLGHQSCRPQWLSWNGYVLGFKWGEGERKAVDEWSMKDQWVTATEASKCSVAATYQLPNLLLLISTAWQTAVPQHTVDTPSHSAVLTPGGDTLLSPSSVPYTVCSQVYLLQNCKCFVSVIMRLKIPLYSPNPHFLLLIYFISFVKCLSFLHITDGFQTMRSANLI